jgi:esterase/lipase
METELFALRRRHKRPATAEQIETSNPLFLRGSGLRERTGILLIHGFTVTPANFRGYAESLVADGYTASKKSR